MRNFAKYYLGYHNKEDEKGGTRNTHGDMRNEYTILVRNLNVRDNSEDLGIDGKIILEWILGK